MGLAYPLLCDSGLNLFTEKKKKTVLSYSIAWNFKR